MSNLTVAQAAKQFEESKREIDRLEPLKDAAHEVLKEYFRKNEKRSYRDRIGYVAYPQRRLDFAALKEELGDRFDDFKRPVPIEYCTLLKP